MASVLDIRNQIETLLVAQLGTYTLGNGYVTPAISVRGQGEPVPGNTKVSGVEVVIIKEPSLRPVSAYNNQKAFSQWNVELLDWDGRGQLGMMAAVILDYYGGTTVTTVPVVEGAGPQARLRLSFSTNPEV